MATRPEILVRETFEAFALVSGPLSGVGNAMALETAETLDQCVAHATLRTAHKGYFAIRVTDTFTGEALIKFYAVRRKSKPTYRFHDHQTRAVHDTYAEHLFDLRAGAI